MNHTGDGLKPNENAGPGEHADTGSSPSAVIREEVKEQHTTHWDEDYLPRAELERLHGIGRREAIQGRWLRALAALLLFVLGASLIWLAIHFHG